VFLFASVLLLSQGLRREAAASLQDAPEVIVQRLVAGRHDPLPAAWLDNLAANSRGRFGARPAVGLLLRSGDQGQLHADGRAGTRAAKDEIVVGAALARVRQIGVGDYLSLRAADGRPLSLQGDRRAGVRLGTAERRPDAAVRSRVSARCSIAAGSVHRRRADRAQSRAKREHRGGENRARLARQPADLARGNPPNLRRRVRLARRHGVRLPGRAAAGVSDLAWDKAAGLSAEEKREIGILKAIGWETGDILRMKLWEGALLSLTAFLPVTLLAWWQVFHGGAAVRAGVEGLGGAVSRFPADAGGGLAANPGAAGGDHMLPYIVATLIPGWRAAIVDPDAAMRG
jgi:hypothetical protein